MTLHERYCQARHDHVCHFDDWMDWRDWYSIELNGDEIRECLSEAERLGITLAPCEERPCEYQ